MLLAIVFSGLGCAGLPPKPKGELCAPDWKKGVAYCSNIEKPDIQTQIPIEQMKICVTPQTWSNIVEYMNKLKELSKQRCQ